MFQHITGLLHKKCSNSCSRAEILGGGMCQMFLLGHLRWGSYWCRWWWVWRLFERVACSCLDVPEVLCLHLFDVKCISFLFFLMFILFWRPVIEFLCRTPSVFDPYNAHLVVLLQGFAASLQLTSVAFTITCSFSVVKSSHVSDGKQRLTCSLLIVSPLWLSWPYDLGKTGSQLRSQ